MRIFIALGSVYNTGPIVVTIDKTSSGWSINWLNKLTNAVTTLIKLDSGTYKVENKTARTPKIEYLHTPLKEAILTFLINADDYRVDDEVLKKAKQSIIDFIKDTENLTLLQLTIKDKARNRQRKAMNKPVFVGKNKEQNGILLGLNWAATKAKVAILGDNGLPGRVVELPTQLVWLP